MSWWKFSQNSIYLLLYNCSIGIYQYHSAMKYKTKLKNKTALYVITEPGKSMQWMLQGKGTK